MEITFVTGNAAKVRTPKRVLAEYGIDVVQHDPERDDPRFVLDELQADDAKVVAVRKAMDAYHVLGKPLFVVDSAFYIPIFGGWPGPLAKQAAEGLGAEGFCKLMWERPWAERQCYFEDVVAFMSHDLAEPYCVRRQVNGIISPEPRGGNFTEQKSKLWSAFIPDDPDGRDGVKTLAEMSPEEMQKHSDEVAAFWHNFAKWLKG